MTLLATAATLSHTTFNDDYPWDKARSSDYFKPRSEAKTIALPSIRQAIPELFLITPSREGYARRESNVTLGSWTFSEYVTSPDSNKRRRVSTEEEHTRQIPRVYRSPEQRISRALSSPRLRSSSITTDSWSSPSPTSSILNGGIPAPVEVKDISKPMVTLPSLKATMNLKSDGAGIREGIVHDGRAPSARRLSCVPIVSPPRAYSISYDFSYHHPSRYQSHPPSPRRPYDRPPFSAGVYPPHYQNAGRFGDFGSVGMGDTKPRKRRGNLPKETTDKLRTWFKAHLQHPYPTEDEKQELMRQTGLQMNQISNWFINARRRQLPAMMNNARAESEAINGGRGKMHGSTAGLSDGDGGSCDEEALEILRGRRLGSMKRGSV